MRFFTAKAPDRFCPGCLAIELQLPLSDVREASRTIATHIVIARGAAVCAGCGRETVGYGLSTRDADAEGLAVAEFLRRGECSAICHSCLARAVKLPSPVFEKAVERLKREHGVRVQMGLCGLCGRSRAIVVTTPLLR